MDYDFFFEKCLQLEKPINIAIIGCGWYGKGVIQSISAFPNINAKLLIDINEEKIKEAFNAINVPESGFSFTENGEEIAASKNKKFASKKISVLEKLKKEDLDIVFECTGNVLVSAKAALYSINNGVPFVTVNSEMDATIGFQLSKLAISKNTIYTNSDGDQPGVLARLISDIKLFGFEPKICGNFKGFLDLYQNPLGVKPFVPPGQNINKICSFADGSKQALELAVVCNAFGFEPYKKGMLGPKLNKEEIIDYFKKNINCLDEKGKCFVDFVINPKDSAGVFVLAKTDNNNKINDLKYLKLGNGPYYLFCKDYHLCYMETIKTMLETHFFGTKLLFPKHKSADVITAAKTDLKEGTRLDGIGGFHCYGLIESWRESRKINALPYGLSEFAVLKKDVKKDDIITYEMVELDENEAALLRKEQEK